MTLPVQYDDVLAALPPVHEVLAPTPLYEWPAWRRRLGFRFFLKHENHQPVGAFKVRGGVRFVGAMTPQQRAAGILGCSTGNHGQSLAFAARHFGADCTIVVPLGNNPEKNQAIRDLGANLVEAGCDFDEARQHLEEQLAPQGGCYIHSANEPLLIAGVGTMACEILERLPEPDVVLVPVGLGSGICGISIVLKALRPQTQVIGVQSENADAVAASWSSGKEQVRPTANTWAEGIATRSSAEMTLTIMRELVDDIVLVSDEELRRASCEILKCTHNLAEGAGAAALAAAYRYRRRFAGRKVVGVLSGGDLNLAELPSILASGGFE